MRYFPLFRGKRGEMTALRKLAHLIAQIGTVIPIIEPVKENNNKTHPLEDLADCSMPFLFICNPTKGDYEDMPETLAETVIKKHLMDYQGWTPAFYVGWRTSSEEIARFRDRYKNYKCALIYYQTPKTDVFTNIDPYEYSNHVYYDGVLEEQHRDSLPLPESVRIVDRFKREHRNADYVDMEKFTGSNTLFENPNDEDFGDFSVQGNYYQDGPGGQTKTVAIHHIHFYPGKTSGPLYVSHFLSERTLIESDVTQKTIEALGNLESKFGELLPNATRACEEYRAIGDRQSGTSLEKLKQLSIMHHLEVMLSEGTLEYSQ